MVRYQINNGSTINLLGVNIKIKELLVRLKIIIQYKTSYKNKILKLQRNGNMIILSMMKIILKQ